MLSPKPRHVPYPQPRPKRLGERRRKAMTLIAAFRSIKGGVLLCSDREEDDGISKRCVDKIYRIRQFSPCELFIAAAGLTSIIKDSQIEIHESLVRHMADGGDILADHRNIFETWLRSIHKKHAKTVRQWPIYMIIVVAPRALSLMPMLYRTEGEMLVPELYWTAQGSGKAVADYLAGHLYDDILDRPTLIAMASFIFRESQGTSSGVGLGANMVLIHEGDKSFEEIGPDAVKEVEQVIPSLEDSLYSHWKENLELPPWLRDKA